MPLCRRQPGVRWRDLTAMLRDGVIIFSDLIGKLDVAARDLRQG
jgi:hypothetical protein